MRIAAGFDQQLVRRSRATRTASGLVRELALVRIEHVQHRDVVALRAQLARAPRASRRRHRTDPIASTISARRRRDSSAIRAERGGRRLVAGAAASSSRCSSTASRSWRCVVRARGGTSVSIARSPHATRPTLSCCWITRYASAASDSPRVLELREPAAGERHRRRRVEHEVHRQLRLLLELLHVVAIELARTPSSRRGGARRRASTPCARRTRPTSRAPTRGACPTARPRRSRAP